MLGVVELAEAHTASYLSEMMEKMCADWGISKAQVVLVITDNAENIKKAATDTFGLSKHAPCFDHTLNLIPTYVLKKKKTAAGKEEDYVPGAPALIAKVKRIVTFFHHSVRASDQLKKKFRSENMERRREHACD